MWLNLEFTLFKILFKWMMSQKDDYDIRNEHKIVGLEIITNSLEEMVTKHIYHNLIDSKAIK